MKMLQEIACQRTLPRSLKRKLSVSRFGKEQIFCWIVGKKGTIPLFLYEKGQGKTFHYVHYCTKCRIGETSAGAHTFLGLLAWSPACAGMIWCLEIPRAQVFPTTCCHGVSRGTASWELASQLGWLGDITKGIVIISVTSLSALG